jgi:hypothetical protein
MSKFDKDTVLRFKAMAEEFLEARGLLLTDIEIGQDAWTVAFQSGIYDEVREDRTVVSAHVQTALESIFPNVVFKDKKRY